MLISLDLNVRCDACHLSHRTLIVRSVHASRVVCSEAPLPLSQTPPSPDSSVHLCGHSYQTPQKPEGRRLARWWHAWSNVRLIVAHLSGPGSAAWRPMFELPKPFYHKLSSLSSFLRTLHLLLCPIMRPRSCSISPSYYLRGSYSHSILVVLASAVGPCFRSQPRVDHENGDHCEWGTKSFLL